MGVVACTRRGAAPGNGRSARHPYRLKPLELLGQKRTHTAVLAVDRYVVAERPTLFVGGHLRRRRGHNPAAARVGAVDRHDTNTVTDLEQLAKRLPLVQGVAAKPALPAVSSSGETMTAQGEIGAMRQSIVKGVTGST